jgi:hypothetical protein
LQKVIILVLRKSPIFLPKIGENCDHNMDPLSFTKLKLHIAASICLHSLQSAKCHIIPTLDNELHVT